MKKTPLAVSDRPFHSDGKFEIREAIWETIVANMLSSQSDINVSPVLAIMLFEDEWCDSFLGNEPIQVQRAQIIRITESCSLRRVTHLFQEKKPLSHDSINAVARGFGRLEGNKFIERIVHGCWSAGNISPEGDLIDLQSVCGLHARSPQFSAVNGYQANYFPYEYMGQQLILESLCDHLQAADSNISAEMCQQSMLDNMHTTIARGLCRLMGLEDGLRLSKKQQAAINKLAKSFYQLAKKTALNVDGYAAVFPQSLTNHAFNFSRFFRAYPLLKHYQAFNSKNGLHFLSGHQFIPTGTEEPRSHCDKLYPEVSAWFKDDIIHDQDQLADCQQQAIQFIQDYDQLHTQLSARSQRSSSEIIQAAYRINEDRLLMIPALSPINQLVHAKTRYAPESVHRVLQPIIRSLQRGNNTESQHALVDFCFYKQGYSCIRLLSQTQHTLCFCLYKKNSNPVLTETDQVALKARGSTLQTDIQTTNEHHWLETETLGNDQLLDDLERYPLFAWKDLSLVINGKPSTLHPMQLCFDTYAE